MNDKKLLFEQFLKADSVIDATNSFSSIKKLCGVENLFSLALYNPLKAALLPAISFKHKRLFEMLDERVKRVGSMANKSNFRVFISGAGPCGLRAAIEAALLDMRVVVVEKRQDFSRHNVIKTWATTVDDLLSLGLKIYLPDIQTHGLLHLGTRDIQLTLLKSGLLLGIEFRYDSTVKGIVERDDQCSAYRAWFSSNSVAASRSSTASSNSDDEPTTTTGDEAATASVESPAVGAGGPEIASVLSFSPCEQRPEELWHTSVVDMIEPAASECGAVVARSAVDGDAAELVEFDGIIVAEGERSNLLRNLGFQRRVTRFSGAIGLVINMKYSPGVALNSLPEEFIIQRSSARWKESLLFRLNEQTIALENLEYMRSTTCHFLVATVMKDSLLRRKILKADSVNPRVYLQRDNVDVAALRAMALELATSVGIPDEHRTFADSNGLHLFDFSCKGKCVPRAKALNSSTVVIPIGDALANPYWPQGLGVNMGFQSAIDSIASLVKLRDSSDAALAVIEQEQCWTVGRYIMPPPLRPAREWTPSFASRVDKKLLVRMQTDAVEQNHEPPFDAAFCAANGLPPPIQPKKK